MNATGNLAELETTSRALLDAHEAHVREATGSVRWERRGLLGRLARISQPTEEPDAVTPRRSRAQDGAG
jgi:hypothetical protein